MSQPYWVDKAKKRMRELGITQADLMPVFNVTTRGAVGHYFSGRSVINVEQLEALSSLLGVRIDYYPGSKNSSSLSYEQVESLIKKWIPRLHQLKFAKYNIDPDSIQELILSDVRDTMDITNDSKDDTRAINEN